MEARAASSPSLFDRPAILVLRSTFSPTVVVVNVVVVDVGRDVRTTAERISLSVLAVPGFLNIEKVARFKSDLTDATVCGSPARAVQSEYTDKRTRRLDAVTIVTRDATTTNRKTT